MPTFNVKGIAPGTGRVVEMQIVAKSAEDAKRRAEEGGLKWVTVIPSHDEEAPPGTVPPPPAG